MDREVKPSFVTIFLIGGSIVGNPKPVLILDAASGDARKVTGTKVTIKSYCVLSLRELLSCSLRKFVSQSKLAVVREVEVVRKSAKLVEAAATRHKISLVDLHFSI